MTLAHYSVDRLFFRTYAYNITPFYFRLIELCVRFGEFINHRFRVVILSDCFSSDLCDTWVFHSFFVCHIAAHFSLLSQFIFAVPIFIFLVLLASIISYTCFYLSKHPTIWVNSPTLVSWWYLWLSIYGYFMAFWGLFESWCVLKLTHILGPNSWTQDSSDLCLVKFCKSHWAPPLRPLETSIMFFIIPQSLQNWESLDCLSMCLHFNQYACILE